MAGPVDGQPRERGALELEAIIRSAETMRRPLELSDVRLEDYDAVYPGILSARAACDHGQFT
jgi:hypothetical protein